MDELAAIRAFLAVADGGGFSEAARRMGVAPSSVTRLVDALEERLGTRLLNRTTRAVTPTDAGARFRLDAARILADLEAAEEAVAERAGAVPRGLLRVTLPMTFGRLHVAPTLGAFHARCPGVELDLRLTDAVEDLAAEGIDLALRIGPAPLPTSRLVARRLAESRRVVCASPDYLARRGIPAEPGDLSAHACLTFRYADGRRAWRFAPSGGGPAVTAEVAGPLRADNAEVLRDAALDGVGLALLPTWLVGPDLAAGRLRTVLDSHEVGPGHGEADPAGGAVWGVFAPERRGSLRLRAFLDHLVTLLTPTPPWEMR